MTNIANNSKYNILFSAKKSKGSYLYDQKTNKYFLDFFGMYSSLALCYNHDIFKTEKYVDDIVNNSQVKVTNCEFKTVASVSFDKKFTNFCNVNNLFTKFHYCATGSLAVEAAVKAALHYKDYNDLCVITLDNCFHGANSLGIFLTDKFFPANKKLNGYPDNYSIKSEASIDSLSKIFTDNNPTCLLIEPIRCSAGDIHLKKSFFKKIRKLCNEHNVPLIFDEIQTGFCTTGKKWYFEHLEVVPDIVIFGKKTQVSGMMCQEKFSKIFDAKNSTRLDVTFNGDVLDMIRAKYIIEAIESGGLINNAKTQGKKILNILKKYPETIINPRGIGLIIAFDCKSTLKRDIIIKEMYENNLLANGTAKKTIRLRPNLAINDKDVEVFGRILNKIIASKE
jgi:L-lysine 6-transaminase